MIKISLVRTGIVDYKKAVVLLLLVVFSATGFYLQTPRTIVRPFYEVYARRTIRYQVRFNDSTIVNQKASVQEIQSIYANSHGWQRAGIVFEGDTTQKPDVIVEFDKPAQIGASSALCSTAYNCQIGNRILINDNLWQHGEAWKGSIVNYHALIINHETGHFLGLEHWKCLCAFEPAPVMLPHQNITSFHLWEPNPWPTKQEIQAAKKHVI